MVHEKSRVRRAGGGSGGGGGGSGSSSSRRLAPGLCSRAAYCFAPGILLRVFALNEFTGLMSILGDGKTEVGDLGRFRP